MTQRKHAPSYTTEFRTRGGRLFNENRADYVTPQEAEEVFYENMNDLDKVA